MKISGWTFRLYKDWHPTRCCLVSYVELKFLDRSRSRMVSEWAKLIGISPENFLRRAKTKKAAEDLFGSSFNLVKSVVFRNNDDEHSDSNPDDEWVFRFYKKKSEIDSRMIAFVEVKNNKKALSKPVSYWAKLMGVNSETLRTRIKTQIKNSRNSASLLFGNKFNIIKQAVLPELKPDSSSAFNHKDPFMGVFKPYSPEELS